MMLRALVCCVLCVCVGRSWAQTSVDEPVSTIAFGSCLRQTRDVPIFEAINQVRPDVFVFLGDNVYADTEEEAKFLEAYAALGAMPGFQTLREQSRVLATWDDHDFGKNDAGAEFAAKDLAKRVMLDFFGDAVDSPRRSREGVYDSYTFGPAGRRVQIILLDTRWFRDELELDPTESRRRYKPTDDATRTVLGKAQWAWLEEQLKQPADVRVIGSSIQVIPFRHKFEHWSNFPHERARLMKLIDDADAHPTIFISGDRHFAEISKADDLTKRPVYDVTSSSLNSSGWGNKNEPNAYRIGPFVGDNNFGLIRIDWDASRVNLSLVGESGAVLSETSLPLR